MIFSGQLLSRHLAECFVVWACLVAEPAAAQANMSASGRINIEDRGALKAGRTAETGAGEVGQRQETDQVAPNIESMGRINNRIQNRVENRLDSRIDRDRDSTSGTISSFEGASGRGRSRFDPR